MCGASAAWPTKRDDSRGAILVEAAIIVPLAIFIIAGILDLGHLFQESTIVYQASRAGARTGGAQTAKKTPQVMAYWCGPASDVPIDPIRCDVVLGETPPWDSLPGTPFQRVPLVSGLFMACHYLREAGLEPAEWRVRVQGPYRRTEDTSEMNWLSVAVERSESGRRCLFCIQQFLESIVLVEKSVFPVQCDT